MTAEICFYGNRKSGFDYLATTDGGKTFTAGSQPDPTRLRYDSLTDALWRALGELREAGVSGFVPCYAPGGKWVARADVAELPYWGALVFEPAAPAAVLSITPEGDVVGFVDHVGHLKCTGCAESGLHGGPTHSVPIHADEGPHAFEACDGCGETLVETFPAAECPACAGCVVDALGSLGSRVHYRCRACGIDFSAAGVA